MKIDKTHLEIEAEVNPDMAYYFSILWLIILVN